VDQTYFDDIRQRIHGRNGLVGIAGVCVFERDRANGHLRDIRWWIEVTPYEGRQIEECLAGMRSTDLLVA
jgi:hypothetical protein